MTELDFTGGEHVNPEMDRMHTALGHGSAGGEESSTTIEFPVDLLRFIDLYAVERRISRRDLTRTILEAWVEKCAPSVKHVKTHSVPITPPPDRRSGEGDEAGEVETKLVTLYMTPQCHMRLKQIGIVIGATLRGVLLGIFYDWQEDDDIAKWILADVLGGRAEEKYYVAPVVFDRTRGEWLFCRGGVWKRVNFPQVAVGFINQMRERLASRGDKASDDLFRKLGDHRKCQSVIAKVKQYVERWGAELFDQDDGIVCGRGPDFGEKEILADPRGKQVSHNAQVWDLETGAIRPAQFDDYIRSTLHVDLPQNLPAHMNDATDSIKWLGLLWGKAPNFYTLVWQMSHYREEKETDDGTLTSAIQEDPEWIAHLCEWMGACLVAGNREEKFLFLTGDGGNGKGLISEIIAKKIGGRTLVHVAPRGLMSRRSNAHRQEQAVLEGVRCLIVDEPRGIDPDLLKQWSGGQEITADHKSGPSITFAVKFLIMLLSNEMPRFPRADPAMQRRLVGIPFDMRFREAGGDFPRKMKPEIFAEIEDELPTVTLILLSMYRATRLRKSFTDCDRVMKASKELWLSANRVIEFIEECLTVDPMGRGMTSKDMWSLYKEWMNSRRYRGALPRRTFIVEMRSIIERVEAYAAVTYSNSVYDMAGKRGRGFLGFSVVESRQSPHDAQRRNDT